MSVEVEYVRRVTRTVLAQLGESAPDWRICAIGYLQIGDVLTPDEPTDVVRVRLESLSGEYPPVAADFTAVAEFVDATLEFISQIQDHAIESTGGGALPPCPGHKHPATAGLVDGVPMWLCLREGAGRYASPILPGFDPRYTIEEYMRDNPAFSS